ncbi:histidine phosphatase family protein [Micromonospora zamorensis]|uniref:histidine phosphatase family protein n=1 Tax=Micromonospora zamorensis TaxID=709883 RepID=UPI0036A8777C
MHEADGNAGTAACLKSDTEGTSMELVLVRHASSTRADDGVWGRLYDAPLASGYEAELAETKAALQAMELRRIISSPLLRCRETTKYLFPRESIEFIEEFRAYHSGVFENSTLQFLQQNHSEYLARSYRERFLRPKFSEESLDAQVGRVAAGIFRVLGGECQTMAIVTHYSVLNILANIAERNWDVEAYADGIYDVRVGCHIRLAVDPATVIKDVQDKFGHWLR